MTYIAATYHGVSVQEYVTGRILRLKVGSEWFKFYAQSEGKSAIVIYIGHGQLTFRIKCALREWARDKGVSIARWGRDEDMPTVAIIK